MTRSGVPGNARGATMSGSHDGGDVSLVSQEHIEITAFRPEHAQGIVDLFRAVYGDGYPIKVFYDAQALTEANAAGQYYSLVATIASGAVVGVQHLFRSSPYPGLYKAGAGLVLKEYRSLGIIKRLLHFLYEEWAPGQPNIEEIFGEAVCNHTHMQKLIHQFNYVETALEVALMPAAAYEQERSAPGRVAGLLVFRAYKKNPQKVYVPRAYKDELEFIYSEVDDIRELAPADKELPDDRISQADMELFDFAQVARIALHRTGSDLSECIGALEGQALDRKCVVIQVWVKTSEAWVGAVVDLLREKGYFFEGALPCWFGDDGLLMQKLIVGPDFDGIHLYSDRARQILDMIKRDWARTQR